MKEKLTESQKAFRKLPAVERFFILINAKLDAEIEAASKQYAKAKTIKESHAQGILCNELGDIKVHIEALYETFFKKKK